jgi:transposase
VIDYETFCKIRDHHDRQGLTCAQTARALGLHPQTVAKWIKRSRYAARRAPARASRIDPFKPLIVRWLDAHPYSAQQIFQRLQEAGFAGGRTIVRDYVRKIRPPRREAFLKLSFAPGECAQVDWGEYGSIGVGSTRRRLSFFVMVLCYSRRMYLEFTVSQTMEHFLACHEHAFAAMMGVPAKVIIDFVPGNKIDVLCPLRFCGQFPSECCISGRAARGGQHNIYRDCSQFSRVSSSRQTGRLGCASEELDVVGGSQARKASSFMRMLISV